MARLYEGPLTQPTRAAELYKKAHELAPELGAAAAGARRCLLAAGQYRDALPWFDTELGFVEDPDARVRLLLSKGAVLEDRLEMPAKALQAYRTALEFRPHDVTALRAVARCERRAQAWPELAGTYDRIANAVTDPRLRASFIAERARVTETRQSDPAQAAPLYETALEGDAHAPGALEAVKRLARNRQQWNALVAALEREVAQRQEAGARAAALARIARIYEVELGDEERAVHALERASSEQGSDRQLLRDLSRLYEKTGRHQGLVSALSRLALVTEDPRERVLLSYRMGQVYEGQLGQPDAARSWYESAFEIDPTFPPVREALAKRYERGGEWQALIGLYVREARASTDSERAAQAYARAGEVLENKGGDPEGAVPHYAKAIELVPDHEVAFDALCRLHAAAGRWRALVELYRRAVDVAKDDARAIAWLFRIGGIYEDRLGEPEAATEAYQQVLARMPEHLGAVQAIQRSAERAGRYEQAVEAIEQEVRLAEDSKHCAELLIRSATLAAERLDQPDRATAMLGKALERAPGHVPTLRLLADMHYRQGRWNEVLETWRQLREALPEGKVRADLLTEMGQLSEDKLGRADQAIGYYRRALEVDPEHADAFEALTRKLEEQQAWADLVRALETRLGTRSDPTERAHLAVQIAELCERRLSDPSRANQMYEQALAAVPHFPPAEEGRQRLLTDRGAWAELAEALEAEADAGSGTPAAMDARYRAGRIHAERLADTERAIRCLEGVLEQDPSHAGALHALEDLYVRTERWDALAWLYRQQAQSYADSAAQLAALRALAQLQQRRDDLGDAEQTHAAILELDSSDEHALEAVAERVAAAGDRDRLLDVESQLVGVSREPGRAVYHQIRVAALLESAGDVRALDAYRRALQLDAQSLWAVRGLSDVAARVGDPQALREAAEYEYRTTGDVDRAVALLVQAAGKHESSSNAEDAATDLGRALEMAPSRTDVAEGLERVLVHLGRVSELVDRLERAAQRASGTDALVGLRLQAARLQIERSGELSAAVATLQRALEARSEDVTVLERLAQCLERSQRWKEAADALHRLAMQLSDPGRLVDVHLRHAAISEEQLEDTGRATASLHKVLEQQPEHVEALTRLSRIEAKRGDHERALATAHRVVELASDPSARADALVQVARIERARGRGGQAGAALVQAIGLQGPDGAAASEYVRHASGAQAWEAYLGALQQYLGTARKRGLPVASTQVELARVLDTQLGRQDEALSTLGEAAAREPANVQVGRALAGLLHRAGRDPQAIEEARRILGQDVQAVDVWRQIATCRQTMGDGGEAVASLAPLVALGSATPEERMSVEGRRARPAQGEPDSFGDEWMRAIQLEQSLEAAACELMAALPETFSKLYPPQLAAYGVSKRQRIGPRSEDPLRTLADRIASLVGAPEYDLYVHDAEIHDVTFELTGTPSLMVPAWARNFNESQLVFLLGRPLSLLARGLHPVVRLGPEEVEAALVGAARYADPSFAPAGVTDPDALASWVYRSMPRRERKSFEYAAHNYAAAPSDVGRWHQAVRRTGARAALLLCDDVLAAVDVWKRVTGEQTATAPSVADLLRFWVSREAVQYRRGAAEGQ